MKLPEHFLENLSVSRYREYLKLLPDIKQENTRIIITLIMTFTAMSFFGIFAINPTLSTIVNLQKQLSDNILVHEQLQTKLNNLSLIQQKYTQLNPDLPIIFNALPQTAQAPILLGQILDVVKKSNGKVILLSALDAQLTGGGKLANKNSFSFSLQATGAYEDLINIAKSLSNIDRVISVDSVSLGKNDELSLLTLTLQGRGYFNNNTDKIKK